jgi:hypothetical protein
MGISLCEDWKRSALNPVYKGKGAQMECGSYTAIKLLMAKT